MNSKERFSNRVDTYVKFRPGYPKEAIDYLYKVVGLGTNSDVVDIGAGTGILSRLLLEWGSQVTAIEPNQAMREASEASLQGKAGFHAIAGSAEATGLPDQSVDFIVCAQAFHWFDRAAAQTEFRRILRPGGKAVLVWNARLTHGSPFLEQYEQLLLSFGTDYAKVNHRNISREILASFFKKDGMKEGRFVNRQVVDFEGLSGRLRSSSYSPVPGHPGYEPMMGELRRIFDRTEHDGKVSIDYETEVFWGEV